MKKLSIILVAFLFIGITNVNAQTTDSQTDTKITEKICAETGKVCSETCENKKDGTCCNGKKKMSFLIIYNKSNIVKGLSFCST